MGFLWSLSLLVGIQLGITHADITVQKFENQTARRIAEFDDVPARGWGAPLGDKGIVGKFASAHPADACEKIQKSPAFSCFALIRRGNCRFDEKVLNAQEAGFQAAVIYNDRSDELIPMSGSPDAARVKIPAVFIGLTDGNFINTTYLYTIDDNVTIIIDGKTGDINWLDRYVWPFLGSVVFVFLLLAAFSVYKWSLDRRRRRRNRLSLRKLKKIPLKKFVKGDPYDVCAICLDEYEEQDELRVLPCNHAYHAKCIDPWLTKTKRQCPVCKRKVSPGSDNSSRSSASGQTENAVGGEQAPSSGASPPPEENPVTTEDEVEDEEGGEDAGEGEVDGESTPLILRSENDDVEVRDRSLLSRLRDAWSSWGERRRRHSSQVTPTPIDHPATRSIGYGSLSEVPTEFNPTLPPPPARSFQQRPSSDNVHDDPAAGDCMRPVRAPIDDSDEEDTGAVERHAATLHGNPNSTDADVHPHV